MEKKPEDAEGVAERPDPQPFDPDPDPDLITHRERGDKPTPEEVQAFTEQ